MKMNDTWKEACDIPCTDQPLLLNARNDHKIGGVYTFGYCRQNKFVDISGNELDVTHWIELPKPPVFRKIGPKKQECTLEASAHGPGSALC